MPVYIKYLGQICRRYIMNLHFKEVICSRLILAYQLVHLALQPVAYS